MKVLQAYFMLLTFPAIFFLTTASVTAASEPSGNVELKAMISELENKVAVENERLAAQSKFLEELRDLIAKYKSRIKELFFSDNFKDGDYTNSPEWIVKSGSFFVNEAGQLSNTVTAKFVEPRERPGKDKSFEKEAIGLVLDGIFGNKKEAEPERKSERPAQVIQPAAIYSKASITPDFEIDIEFVSKSEMGEMEIVLLGTENLTPRYRLNYKKNGSQDRPIEIIRENKGRKFIIEASTKFPQIDDGRLHKIKWVRYRDGVMNVFIDDDIVLDTHEVYFKNRFTGIEIQNNGGTYQWASIEIYKASEQLQD